MHKPDQVHANHRLWRDLRRLGLDQSLYTTCTWRRAVGFDPLAAEPHLAPDGINQPELTSAHAAPACSPASQALHDACTLSGPHLKGLTRPLAPTGGVSLQTAAAAWCPAGLLKSSSWVALAPAPNRTCGQAVSGQQCCARNEGWWLDSQTLRSCMWTQPSLDGEGA